MATWNVIDSVNCYKSFYNGCKRKLFGYLLKVTGDYYLSADLMQESFTRYLERYGDDEPNESLLFRIARNLMSDHFRRKSRQVSLPEQEVPANTNHEHHLMVREQYRIVLAAMQKLDHPQREILALVAEGAMSYRQIAILLGISEANVKVKVHRARLRLRKYLEEDRL